MKKVLFGELIVILILIISIDYIPWFIAWIPFIVYNYFFIERISIWFDKYIKL